MKKMIFSLTLITGLSSLLICSQNVIASEFESELPETNSEETQLIEFNIEKDYYEKVTFEEEDGTLATIIISKELPEMTTFATRPGGGSSGGPALTAGNAYKYTYKGSTDTYSFKTHLTGSPLKINKIYDLEYNWKSGKIKDTSIKKHSSKDGTVQLIYNGNWGGTKTETANVKLNTTGRSGVWHLYITRNGSSKGVVLKN